MLKGRIPRRFAGFAYSSLMPPSLGHGMGAWLTCNILRVAALSRRGHEVDFVGLVSGHQVLVTGLAGRLPADRARVPGSSSSTHRQAALTGPQPSSDWMIFAWRTRVASVAMRVRTRVAAGPSEPFAHRMQQLCQDSVLDAGLPGD